MNSIGPESDSLENLLLAICSVETKEEALAFLNDLCTGKEITEMAQRFDTAVKLYNGVNYLSLSADKGISSATISRVNKCLKKNGGYVKAIEKLGLKKQ